jgi:hypothetical protein
MWLTPDYIDHKIRAALQQAELEIGYEQLEVGLFRRKITLQQVNGQLDIPGSGRIAGQIAALDFEGISWLSLLTSSPVRIQHVTARQPDIRYMIDTTIGSSRDSAQRRQGFDIRQFSIIDGIAAVHHLPDSSLLARVDTVSVTIRHIQLGTKDTSGVNRAGFKDLSYQFKGFRMPDQNQLHELRVDQIKGNTTQGELSAEGISFVPLYNESKFSRQLKFKSARIEAHIPRLNAINLDHSRLLDKALILQKVDIPEFEITAFVDKNLPHNTGQYKKLPQHLLAELTADVCIDSIQIGSSYVKYAELLPGKTEAGYVDFDELNVLFTNICNTSITSEQPMEAAIRGRLYGKAPMNVFFQFPMMKPPWTYYYRGKVSDFNMKEANSIIDKAAEMKFLDGQVNELSFQVAANDDYSEGDIEFYYEKVDIKFLKKDQKFFRELVNGLIEWLAFPQENLPGEKHRVGQIYVERDKSRFFLRHFWYSILSGIKSTILPNLILPEELKHVKKE